MLTAMIAVLCTFVSLAAAQDQPAPKWELYGGYSFFQPGTDVHGQLPGALLPVGDHRLMPDAFHDVDKLGFLFGGGVDFKLCRHVALRLIKADYAFSNYQYGASSVTPRTEIRGLRLQVGLNAERHQCHPSRLAPSTAGKSFCRRACGRDCQWI
jgi:opacity protein-like surface antigen